METQKPGIRHIVLVHFRPEATDAQKQAVRDALARMPGVVPGLVAMRAGDNIGHAPSGVDYASVMDFESREALARYREHPAHRAYVEGPARAAVASITSAQIEL